MKKALLIKLLSCLVPMLAFAQEPQVMTLGAVLNKIEQHNPMLAGYAFKIQALDKYADGATAWEATKIGAGFWMTPYNFQKNSGQFMLSAEQMIPNHAKQAAKKDYLLSLSPVEAANKKVQRNELFAAAKTTYFRWQIIEKKRAILTENEALLSYVVQAAELNYTYGKETLANIYKAKAAVFELQNTELVLEYERLVQQVELNTLMNQDKNLVFEVDSAFEIKNYAPLDLRNDTLNLAAHRSDIAAIEQNIRAANFNIAREKTEAKPEFSIRYDHMFALGNQPWQFNLLGMMTLPMTKRASRGYQANIAAMGFEIQAMNTEKQVILNETTGKLRQLGVQIGGKKRQLDLFDQSLLPALRNNYQTSLLAYQQNTGNLFIVLDAIIALQNAQLQRLDIVAEILQLQTGYEKELEQF